MLPMADGAGGVRSALESLHGRHGAALTAYARAITGRRDWAEEAVQEAFAEMLACPTRLAASRDPRSYLFGAVRLTALAVRRRDRRWRSLASPLPERPWLVPAPGATEPAGDLEALARAVAALPEPEREAVVMKTWGGLTFVQMGEAAGIPQKTMESRYYAGLGRLREALA